MGGGADAPDSQEGNRTIFALSSLLSPLPPDSLPDLNIMPRQSVTCFLLLLLFFFSTFQPIHCTFFSDFQVENVENSDK